MRTLPNLPLVSCKLGLSDGIADIASFRSGATNANWTHGEINVAIVKAVYKSSYFDDVGEVLHQYCTDESGVEALLEN